MSGDPRALAAATAAGLATGSLLARSAGPTAGVAAAALLALTISPKRVSGHRRAFAPAAAAGVAAGPLLVWWAGPAAGLAAAALAALGAAALARLWGSLPDPAALVEVRRLTALSRTFAAIAGRIGAPPSDPPGDWIIAPNLAGPPHALGPITIDYDETLDDDPEGAKVAAIVGMVERRTGGRFHALIDPTACTLSLYDRPALTLTAYPADLVARSDEGTVHPTAVLFAGTDAHHADAAVDAAAALVWRPLPTPGLPWAPNLLISGLPGAGKTSLEFGLCLYVLRVLHDASGARLRILDAKGGGSFAWLLGQPGLDRLHDSADQLPEAMQELAALVADRYGQARAARHEDRVAPAHEPVYVIFDELVEALNQHPGILAPLVAVLRQGRQAGVYLAAGAQDLYAANLGGGYVRDLFAMHAALGPHRGPAAAMALGDRWGRLGPAIPADPGAGVLVTAHTAAPFHAWSVADPLDPYTDPALAARSAALIGRADPDWRARALTSPTTRRDRAAQPSLCSEVAESTGQPCRNPAQPGRCDRGDDPAAGPAGRGLRPLHRRARPAEDLAA